jgi:hypothetical protein
MQQVNLLPPVRHDYTLHIAGIVAVALFAAAGIYAFSSSRELERLRAEEKQARARTDSMRAEILKLQGSDKGPGVAKLDAEVAALRTRVDSVREFLRQVDSGALGHPGGYPEVFKAIALSVDENVWVTGLTVTQSGRSVSIRGGAITNDAAIEFARRAREHLAVSGIRMQTLEVTTPPEQLGPVGFISFRLS